MKEIELTGLLAILLIVLVFYLFPLRKNIFLNPYNLGSLLIVALFVFRTIQDYGQFQIEWIVMTLGLALFWFGLFVVRIMLKRSVSLSLLSRKGQSIGSQSVSAEIATRLKDLKTYGMVNRSSDETVELKGFGKILADVVFLLYSILRIH
jgi:hypothetical protein